VATLREAFANGSAHEEGKTEIDGRTVERIRYQCPTTPCRPGVAADYAYVDPETFFFVREEWPKGFGLALAPGEIVHFDVVIDYLTFEYLPRTQENLALTDIRAQHPNATLRPQR
jgi:hypothetical protein